MRDAANKTSCFGPTTSLVGLTQLILSLSLSFPSLLLAVKYSSQTGQTFSANISHQTWKTNSDWKITLWSPRSNYAGLVYDLSLQIHYPPAQFCKQPFNLSFQLAHHFPSQVGMSKEFPELRYLLVLHFHVCVHCVILWRATEYFLRV